MIDNELNTNIDEMWDFMEMLGNAEDTFRESNGDVLSAVDLELYNEWRDLCKAFRDFAVKADNARHTLEDDEFEFGKHIFSDFD